MWNPLYLEEDDSGRIAMSGLSSPSMSPSMVTRPLASISDPRFGCTLSGARSVIVLPASAGAKRMVYMPGSLFVASTASRSEIPSGPGFASSSATVTMSPFTPSAAVVTTISTAVGAAADGTTRRPHEATVRRSFVPAVSHGPRRNRHNGPSTRNASKETDGCKDQVDAGRVEEEPDLPRRRRRLALAAGRPLHRDRRALQPADGPVDDRARRGQDQGLGRQGRSADRVCIATHEGRRPRPVGREWLERPMCERWLPNHPLRSGGWRG